MSVDKTTSMSFGGMFSKAPNLLGCQVYYANLKTPKAYSPVQQHALIIPRNWPIETCLHCNISMHSNSYQIVSIFTKKLLNSLWSCLLL